MDGTGLTRFRPRILSGHLLHKCIQICSGMTHRVDYGKNSRDTMQHKLLFHYICIALFTGATQNASECHTKNAKTFLFQEPSVFYEYDGIVSDKLVSFLVFDTCKYTRHIRFDCEDEGSCLNVSVCLG